MVGEEKVWEALATVMDPEVPFSVVELGLVYGVDVSSDGRVHVKMTLTTRGCPLVRRISADIEEAVLRQTGASAVTVEIVWDPSWSPMMASEAVRAHFRWS